MANEEQLKILKQGVEIWNKWRTKNEDVQIRLFGTDLSRANLSKADLHEAHISKTDLSGADLSEADLSGGVAIDSVNLHGANLTEAQLRGADLSETDLSGADLTRAELTSAELYAINLCEANLCGAELSGAKFYEINLSRTNFDRATVGETSFRSLDLSEVIGLETVRHEFPSTIGTDTLEKSKGKIPEAFLRGCGLLDWEIEFAKLYNPDLSSGEIDRILYKIYDLRATQAIQINPLFISYSHGDTAFVDKMDKALTNKGVRFWRDTHDMVAGRMEKQVDRGIRQNPTVLLVLSKNSLQSDWVEHEVNEARKTEKELGRDVLCPVALDDSWKSSKWEERIIEQIMKYNILDFSKWENESMFEEKFTKLLSGLDLFYKKPEG